MKHGQASPNVSVIKIKEEEIVVSESSVEGGNIVEELTPGEDKSK